MKRITTILLLVAITGISCSSKIASIFETKKTPHEAYAEELDDSGLEDTEQGRQWLAAAGSALKEAQSIAVPYRISGFFPTDKPRALGLRFNGKRGEKLTFSVSRKNSGNFVLYADIFREENGTTTHLFSADTTRHEFSYPVEETGTYILRLQPELYRTGAYQLSISAGPSLGFPVSGKANIGSFWGADRDGGKRRHEGIDIFAAKRTPVVAAGDGVVTGVREGGIGGKTVWLRLFENNVTLYYAHLDEQLVQTGQQVKKGDKLGLVGNTGNAKTTPPHLHFGVYTSQGPIDPLPFVNKAERTAPPLPDKKLTALLRLIRKQKVGDETIALNTLLVPVAFTSKGFIAELPDGNMIHADFSSVQTMNKPIRKVKTKATTPVLQGPSRDAAVATMIQPGKSISVMASFKDYLFVRTSETEGWVLESHLKG